MQGSPAVLLLFAAAAGAQQTISLPSGLVGTGTASQQVLGGLGDERIQSIFAPAVLPPGDTVITVLQLRGRQPAPSQSVTITLTVASAGVPLPEHASMSSFAANRGSTPQTMVFPGVVFPAVSLGVPAVVSLPLTVPFLRQAGQPLLVEMDYDVVSVTGGGPPQWAVESHVYPPTFWGPTEQLLGTGCANGVMMPHVKRRWPPEEWAEWRFFSDQPTNTLSVLLLGLSDQQYGVLPLPIPLDNLGAPGCSLQVSVDYTQLVLGTLTGFSPPTMFYAHTVLPRDPVFAGTRVSGQFAILTPGLNPAGLVMTPHARYDLLNPPTAERMRYSYARLDPSVPPDVIQAWLPDHAIVFNAVLQ